MYVSFFGKFFRVCTLAEIVVGGVKSVGSLPRSLDDNFVSNVEACFEALRAAVSVGQECVWKIVYRYC
jgi:hypothetical protein